MPAETAARQPAEATAADPTAVIADPTAELVDDPSAIATLRTQIDALDAALLRLIAERAQLSRRVQTARINAGGARVALGRERAIHDRYRDVLGGHGTTVADAVLRVCRGDY
ncbi:MAG TPA: chorismate mutase [Jatrophihabitans sp.]|nr:chorismate mutase [Jatrophihabitans sp.]